MAVKDNIIVQLAQDPALPEVLRLVNRWRALPPTPSKPSTTPFTLQPVVVPLRAYVWSQENPIAAKIILAGAVVTVIAGIAYIGHALGKRI